MFGIDIEAYARCGGKLKVIASIGEPAMIAKILAHLERTALDQYQAELPLGARAPPVQARLISSRVGEVCLPAQHGWIPDQATLDQPILIDQAAPDPDKRAIPAPPPIHR